MFITPIVGAMNIPRGGSRLIASGANVATGVEIKTGHALAISAVAAALITFVGDGENTSVNVPPGNWLIMLDEADMLRTVPNITSTATCFVWVIDTCKKIR